MFYLGSFCKIVAKNPISGLTFVLLTMLLTLWSVDLDDIEKKINFGPSSLKRGDHFYSLIEARENLARIARKISGLPGVANVRQISEREIDERLKGIFSEIGTDFNLETNYGGLQIVYLQGLEERSQNLIREYLIRLAGRDKVMLGPIKRVQVVKDPHKIEPRLLKKVIVYTLLAVIVIFWQISYLIFGKHISESAYLISQYQQKKRVSFKILLSGIMSIFILCVGGSLLRNQLYLYGLVGLGLYFTASILLKYKRESWLK